LRGRELWAIVAPVTVRKQVALAIVIVLVVGTVALIVMTPDDGATGPSGTASGPPAGESIRAPGEPLAGPGYVPRDLAAGFVPQGVLRLAFEAGEGQPRLCTIGGGDPDGPPLARAVCRGSDVLEVAEPARAPKDPITLGRQRLSIVSDELVVEDLESGARTVVGALPPGSEALRACVTSDAAVVVIDGRLSHGNRDVFVSFGTGDGWSELASGPARIFEPVTTCRGTEVTLSWLEPIDGGRILMAHQLRCRPGQCEAAQERFSIAGADPIIADLAGRVLAVWNASDGTRMRLAPLTELDEAPDITDVHDPALRVLARRLFVRGGTAVLLLRTAEGTYGLRIDTIGSVTPLPVEEEET
jgi:hypothetical protein